MTPRCHPVTYCWGIWNIVLAIQGHLSLTYNGTPLERPGNYHFKVTKFGPFPRTIFHKSCLFYPSWQATSFERPPSWVAFIEGFHTTKMRRLISLACTGKLMEFAVIWIYVHIWKIHVLWRINSHPWTLKAQACLSNNGMINLYSFKKCLILGNATLRIW